MNVCTLEDSGILGMFPNGWLCMSASIVTTATTLEGQLFEVAAEIQKREATTAAADPTFSPLLTLSTDAEGGTITVAATVPATVGGTAGTVSFAPTPYLP